MNIFNERSRAIRERDLGVFNFVEHTCQQICTKANRTLGFLRRNVWDPQSILLHEELKKVQKRAARFVTGNYTYETGSMTGIISRAT